MDIKAILAQVIQPYAGEMLNGHAYLTVSPAQDIFTIVSVAKFKSERVTHLSLHVRVDRDHIIIEYDDSNEPLVDALVHAGVPRSQIILAYAGEPVPESI
ncbi:MAG: XisI protein [Anaerolineae bacterium]|nr:XisI protein [Anaerolineae bacterium]